ncbi:hypothetical protein Cgig2_006350 [Carnegiea gigantea]|uniref:Uncharacterized protein n=1 Tax=Carnegiea gigantea TaxID=171969 RepID=A0A9Q1JPL8_9CARY|nr:hypothetical protein Cgig2_006350 [Carnegiea gigantea]
MGTKGALGSWPQAAPLGLPRPLPRFDLGVATRYAHDSHIPEMVQTIFYAMVVDNAAKLGLFHQLTMDYIDRRLRRAQASRRANPLLGAMPPGGPMGRRVSSFPTFRDTTHAAEYVKDNIRWSMRESSSLRLNLLSLHFVAFCPEFDHTVAMQFAHAAHIPEMVQAIFYAMVINDTAEPRLLSRETMGSLMLDLKELRWDIIEAWMLFVEERLRGAQVPRLVETVYNPWSRPEVTSRLRDAPLPSSDEE